jgi:type I restriction enzyme S subunit
MRTRRIAELVADGSILAIQDGNHGGQHPKASEYVLDGIPFVMASDIRDGQLSLSTAKKLPRARTDRLRVGFSRSGDVLLTHKGTVGEVAIVPSVDDYVMLTPQVTYYRTNPDQLDRVFLGFAFRSSYFQDQLQNISAQSTRPYVAISTQRELSIPWHPLPVQRRIASILGAYDQLIEVNRRRIAVHEEMARRLFEEWFVRFRFPGHEHSSVIETVHGPLPKGWRWAPADKLIYFDPPTALPRDGMKPFLPMAALRTDCSLIEPFEVREGNAGSKFTNGDTLFARITPCLENGKTGLVRDLPGPVGFGSTEFIVMRGGVVGPAFVYLLARLPDFREHARKSMTGASGRQRARVETLRAFPVPGAPRPLYKRFEAIASPLLELPGRLGAANQRLAQSRDLLLPRLISGELSVAAAERELEDAA